MYGIVTVCVLHMCVYMYVCIYVPAHAGSTVNVDFGGGTHGLSALCHLVNLKSV
jgi:hypothetical protein